jgi:V/A-type H+-transporting ATPase subunit E
MKQETVINNLQQALLDRADKLAEEYLARAERARQHVLEDAQEKLHLREQRETLAAQAAAERSYRRKIQANELQLRGKLDELRWQLIQSILNGLPEQLSELAVQDSYLPLLQKFLKQAAASIDSEQLVAEVNARDLALLQPQWQDFLERAQVVNQVRLAATPRQCIGGILLRTEDNRIRVDNTFDGRMERFAESLQQVITERLFAREASRGGILHG